MKQNSNKITHSSISQSLPEIVEEIIKRERNWIIISHPFNIFHKKLEPGQPVNMEMRTNIEELAELLVVLNSVTEEMNEYSGQIYHKATSTDGPEDA